MKTIPAKSILSSYSEGNSWFGTHYNMNLYKGCSHGCIYCDSRSECYNIKDFDTVKVKENALEILRRELRSKKKKGVIGTGSMSDPYNPYETKYQHTRKALELIDYYGFGVAIATKSDLVVRDIDLLQRIQRHSPVIIKLTITTIEDELCKKIEPSVAISSKRFEALKMLSNKGVFAGILMMPILPYINDTLENIIGIVQKAKAVGAKFILAYGIGMSLRSGQREYYYEQLKQIDPSGQLILDYQQRFGTMYHCSSPRAKELWKIFKRTCEEEGILYKMEDIIKAYQRGYYYQQLTLF